MVRQPLSVRRGVREPFGLLEGVPDHLRVPLWNWIGAQVANQYGGPQQDRVDKLLAAAQIDPGPGPEWHRMDRVQSLVWDDDDAFLDVVDAACLLAVNSVPLKALDTLLELGSSVWEVDLKGKSLERRTSEAERDALRAAVAPGDLAAEHLVDAWDGAFRHSGKPGDAWGSAVQAVEALLGPIVEPRNGEATLGSMVKALRAKPEKWEFALPGEAPGDGTRYFIQALELVPYEKGRHGTDPRKPTPEEARVVVLQAVAIVGWLREGALRLVAS